MKCSACECHVPAMKQWGNRQNGYSICRDCVLWLQSKDTPAAIQCDFGLEGVHYASNEQFEERMDKGH